MGILCIIVFGFLKKSSRTASEFNLIFSKKEQKRSKLPLLSQIQLGNYFIPRVTDGRTVTENQFFCFFHEQIRTRKIVLLLLIRC